MDIDIGDLMIAVGRPVDFTDRLVIWAGLGHESYVLEAGCGTGKLGINLASRLGCSVVLLDKDKEALSRAARYVGAVEALVGERIPVLIREGDVLKLPFHDGTFDLAFNEGVVEHFKDPLVPLKEIARVSAAWVVTIVPNANNKKQMDMARLQMEAHAGTDRWESYEKPMTQEELEGYLRQAGLSEVRSTLLMPENIPPISRSEYRMIIAGGRKP